VRGKKRPKTKMLDFPKIRTFRKFAPGWQHVAPGEQNFAPGVQNFATGSKVLLPGNKIFPTGSKILPPGSKSLLPGSKILRSMYLKRTIRLRTFHEAVAEGGGGASP